MKLNKIFLLIIGLFLVSSVIHTETYLKNDTDTSTELLSFVVRQKLYFLFIKANWALFH